MSKWKTYRLGDIIQLKSGGTPDKSNPDYWGGSIPWISAKSMYDDFISTSDLFITEEGLQAGSKIAKKDSILLLTRGSGLFNRIPVCYVVSDVAYNQDVKNIVLKQEDVTSIKFLYYWLYGNKELLSSMLETTGIGAGKIDTKRFLNLSISLPSQKEQARYIHLMDLLFDKIELNRRINANLEAQAQALFRSWFVDFEPFRDGPFVDSELGKIPASLKIEHIGNIPHKIESGKRPKGGASEHGIPSIGAENIKGLGIYDYAKTKFIPEDFASTMKKGKINGYELLIYKDGGKPGYFIPNFTIFGEGFPYKEMYINEHVFCLDFFDKGFNTFAYFYMRTPYIMNQLNTIGGKAAIPGINTKDIESLPIFTNENEKVKEFGTLFLPTIKTILQNCVENKTLSALRDTLLPKLIAGEI